ncbi:hypothetical protein Cni_G07191 [Canna indica]|uniref:Core-2/I-branching beta-1,6-N-acetylglucosaminyltransferase family protein n=1 Tax=Canna indica TaxID=4628 RepID=A0AAQ3JY21_9LILI|nr:hypothetical protein Cni_G07191 [Canna indica]
MNTSSSSTHQHSLEVEIQPLNPHEEHHQAHKQQQIRVCATEEVSLLIKIFALVFLLVLATSVLTSSAGEKLWTWSLTTHEEPVMTYQPPTELMHNMSDGELFRVALDVSRMNRLHYKMTPKIAFLFLTRGPLPLSPLWEKYFEGYDGLYSIYIHTHPAYRPQNSSSSVFYKRQIPSKVLSWGSMSMVDGERRLLANALLDLSNERFILLSESCIPLFNMSFTYHYLMNSRYNFVDDFDNPAPDARGRYNPKLAPEINVTEWRKGAQWFEMSRRVAVIVVNETKYYAKFSQLQHEMILQDEHYIPTVLYLVAPRLIAYRTLTWARWIGGSHPVTFGKDDVSDTLLREINEETNCTYNDRPSTTCYLFARKFAPSALEALLKLAPTSFGFGL